MFADSVSILEWILMTFSKHCFRKFKYYCCCLKVKVTDMETCLVYALNLMLKLDTLSGDIHDPLFIYLFKKNRLKNLKKNITNMIDCK